MLLGQSLYLCGIADEDKVCNLLLQHLVGCYKCALLLCLGEHDALLVCLCTRYNLFN